MPRHLTVILLLGAVLKPRDAWKYRESFKREWKRGTW